MKDFEKYIQEKASAFEMNPMPDSFDKVMDALEKKKKRRFIFWLWFLVPGILIGAVGILGIQLNSNFSSQNTTASTNTPITSTNTSRVNTNNTQIKTRPTQTEELITDKGEGNITRVEKTNKNFLSEKNIRVIKDTTNKQANNTVNNLNKKEDEQNNVSLYKLPLVHNFRIKEIGILGHVNHITNIPFGENKLLLGTTQIPNIHTNPVDFVSPKTSKFSLGIYTDLGVSKSNFYTSVPVDSTPKGNYTTARKSADKFIFSYSAGLQFRYSPIKFLSIETGIGFTHYESYQIIANSSVTTSSLLDQNEPDTVLSFASYSSSYKEYYNTYDYISIPFKLYFQKKWTFIGVEAGGGVVFDIPVNTRSYAADENTGVSYLVKDVNHSRLNKFGVLAVANLNLVFHIGKFSLFAGPTFKYRLNSMFDDQYIMQQHPYFIGAQIGVRYNF